MASEAEIQAIARFIIGFGTEQDERWRDYNIDFAGRVDYRSDGSPLSFKPVGNSGYSLGSLQWDFGQQSSLSVPFVDAFVEYIARNPAQPHLASDPEFVGRALSMTGSKLSAHSGLGLNRQDVEALSAYVRTKDGSDWVNENIDINLIGSDAHGRVVVGGRKLDETLVAISRQTEGTSTFKAFSKARETNSMNLVYAIGMKTYNQSPASFRKRFVAFLSAARSASDVADWHKGLSGGLQSGVKAATDLSLFWATWKEANAGSMLKDLLAEMTAAPLDNPVTASEDRGIYVLAKQVFEDTALFDGFTKAIANNKDYIPKKLFSTGTGAIAIHPYTKRLRPGMLSFKGQHYVWNAEGRAFVYQNSAWTKFAAKDINIKRL